VLVPVNLRWRVGLPQLLTPCALPPTQFGPVVVVDVDVDVAAAAVAAAAAAAAAVGWCDRSCARLRTQPPAVTAAVS